MKRKRFRAVDFQEMAPCKQREFEIKNKNKTVESDEDGKGLGGREMEQEKENKGRCASAKTSDNQTSNTGLSASRKKETNRETEAIVLGLYQATSSNMCLLFTHHRHAKLVRHDFSMRQRTHWQRGQADHTPPSPNFHISFSQA